jgi:hypothetical protein
VREQKPRDRHRRGRREEARPPERGDQSPASAAPNTRWPTELSEVSRANCVALIAGAHTDIRYATNAAVPIALAIPSHTTAAQKIGVLAPASGSHA